MKSQIQAKSLLDTPKPEFTKAKPWVKAKPFFHKKNVFVWFVCLMRAGR